jgi:hypothetical protein
MRDNKPIQNVIPPARTESDDQPNAFFKGLRLLHTIEY